MSEKVAPIPTSTRRFPLRAALLLTVACFACSIYANLSFVVTNKSNLRYFPPFKPYVDGNMNRHLGAEYFNIGKALASGEGFANPFSGKTGPTAWMPPV